MKIMKQPALRSGDTKEVVPNYPASLVTAPDSRLVQLSVTNITDRDGKGSYNWYVQLSLADVALIIKAAANQLYFEHPDELHTALSNSEIDLHRLLMCAAGIKLSELSKPTSPSV